MEDLRTICIDSTAFYELIGKVVEHINVTYAPNDSKPWIGTEQAMTLLQIKSKTTLQQLRSEGKIRYSQPQHKIILYDRNSLLEYIEKHARETF